MKKMKMNQIVRIPFRFVSFPAASTSSVTATWNEIDITPASFGSRLTDILDDFQKYRFTELKITQFPLNVPVPTHDTTASPNSVSCSQVHGLAVDLSPSSLTGTIGGFAAAAQLSHYVASADRPVSIVLKRKELLGQSPVEWFDTKSTGTPGDSFLYQGTIYYQLYTPTMTNASTSAMYHQQIDGVCEFCQPADPADTLTLERRVVRDIERLKKARAVEEKVHSDLTEPEESGPASLQRRSTAASVVPPQAQPTVVQDDLVFVVPKTSKSWLR